MEILNNETLENVNGGITWVYSEYANTGIYTVFSQDDLINNKESVEAAEMTAVQLKFFKSLRSKDTFICANCSVPELDR